MNGFQTAKQLIRLFCEKGLTVCTAESCTGGLIAKLLTDVAGSSAVFRGGFVTYTNEIKQAMLGVSDELLSLHSEVSSACAMAMAKGARERMEATLAVSTTGFAGPGGGNERDPVGTVYIGVCTPYKTFYERFSAPVGATRSQIRNAAALRALELLLAAAEEAFSTP